MEVKFDVSKNAYTLPGGRLVDASSELTVEEIRQLIEVPATAYDLLRLRTVVHELGNAVAAHITTTNETYEEIKSMLTVDLSNGKPRDPLPIGKAFQEMYDRERGRRDRLLLWEGIKRNKYFIIATLALTIIGISYYFNQQWILTALIPFLISLIKDLIKK